MKKSFIEEDASVNQTALLNVPLYQTAVYTMRAAAELSKCSYSTIRRAIENGRLVISYIGNQPRVIGEQLLAWIQAEGITGRSKATM